jgi:hypothetical protein
MEIKTEVENKNWKFIFVNLELTENSLVSSIQSKYIKFLKFLEDYTEYTIYKFILYFDHKLFIQKSHINTLFNIANAQYKQNFIIIRSHETYSKSIWEEVERANGQERYNAHMPETIDIINNKINNNEIIADIEICNTGLLLYSNYIYFKPLLDDIYNTCVKLNQPECQIIWAIYSQKYLNNIIIIDFYKLSDLLWKEPEELKIIENVNNYSNYPNYYTNFIFTYLIILFLCLILYYFYTIG